MATPQWIKKLGGHAGELYVAAELSKRGIPNSLLPENFSDDDLMAGSKDGLAICFIQVKSCHPDRSQSFILRESDEKWCGAPGNQFVAFVWLGGPSRNEPPRYWIAPKSEVGQACVGHSQHGTGNWERRFRPGDLPKRWENNWQVIQTYLQGGQALGTSLEPMASREVGNTNLGVAAAASAAPLSGEEFDRLLDELSQGPALPQLQEHFSRADIYTDHD